jgi:hypothetical protein
MLLEALELLRISEIHIHHLIDFPAEAGAQLTLAAERLGIDIRLSVHDYYALCPRVNLINAEGRFCGQPELEDCDRCLSKGALIERSGPIREWRANSQRLLDAAREVVVPSTDVALRLATLGAATPIRVAPHEEDPPPKVPGSMLVPAHESVRVLAIGAINLVKGFDVLMGLAHAAERRKLPLEVSLLGYSSDDGLLSGSGVRLLGRYFDNELLEKIIECDPHIIFVPSVWPETYCYVLSGALRSGRRIAVFDLGAQAERARRHDPHHLILPLSLSERPDDLADVLLRATRAPDPADAAAWQADLPAMRREG